MARSLAEERKRITNDLIAKIQSLLNIDPISLVRTDTLGSAMDFRDIEKEYEQIQQLYRDLQSINYDDFPINVLADISERANVLLSIFQEIMHFDPNKVNSPQLRKNLVERVIGAYAQQYSFLSPIISLSLFRRLNLDGYYKKLNEQAEAGSQSFNAIMINLNKKLDDAETILSKIKSAATETAVAKHASYFKEQAIEHKKAARVWLFATGVLGLLTIAFGGLILYLFSSSKAPMEIQQSIQLSVVKLIIFSVLSTAAIWSSRIYKAHRHNYVISKHRQNALSTFEAFTAAASDEQTKNAVIVQAARSIFSCQPSGYITSSETSEGPQILEIMRSITNFKSSQ